MHRNRSRGSEGISERRAIYKVCRRWAANDVLLMLDSHVPTLAALTPFVARLKLLGGGDRAGIEVLLRVPASLVLLSMLIIGGIVVNERGLYLLMRVHIHALTVVLLALGQDGRRHCGCSVVRQRRRSRGTGAWRLRRVRELLHAASALVLVIGRHSTTSSVRAVIGPAGWETHGLVVVLVIEAAATATLALIATTTVAGSAVSSRLVVGRSLRVSPVMRTLAQGARVMRD